MAVSGLVKGLVWQDQRFTGGWPDNVGQMFFLLHISH